VEDDSKYNLYPAQYVEGFSGVAFFHTEEEVLVQYVKLLYIWGENTYSRSGFVHPTRIFIGKC
jgi:hypothetical protein